MMSRFIQHTKCSRVLIGSGLVLVGLFVSGCRQSPITENDERSPFDRYDLIRDEFAPAYLQDEYGRKRPNLRGRLVGR